MPKKLKTRLLIVLLIVVLLVPAVAEQSYMAKAIPRNTANSVPQAQGNTQKESVKSPFYVEPVENSSSSTLTSITSQNSNDPTAYTVTFSMTGLGGGYPYWDVSFDGMHQDASTWWGGAGYSILFSNVPNGTYYYTVYAEENGWVASPSSGYVTVNGSDIVVNVAFSSAYTVTFSMTGLGGGYPYWDVSFDGMHQDASTWWGGAGYSILFSNVPNGTYYYTVYAEENGWVASPSSGYVTVNGSDIVVNVAFSTFSVGVGASNITLTENGLPSGTNWGVSIAGIDEYSNSSTIVFTNLFDGNYSFIILSTASYNGFLVGSGEAYVPSPFAGTISLKTGNAAVNIVFSPLPSLTFNETGLDLSSYSWYVSVDGWYFTSNSSSFTVYNIPQNASLEYVVSDSYWYSGGFLQGSSEAYWPSPFAGTISLSNAAMGSVSIVFRKMSVVTFYELNVPGGASWGVSLDGQSQTTVSSNFLYFYNAPINNTLLFTALPPSGYMGMPRKGNIYVGIFDAAELILFINSTFVFVSGNSTLSVHVVDNNGNSVSGVYVTFYDQSQNPLGVAETNSTGYTQPVQLPSAIFLSVAPLNKPYYSPPLEPLVLSAGVNTATIKITPFPRGKLLGRVAYLNGSPADGALVTACQLLNGFSFSSSASTNATGQYIMSLSAGNASIRVSSPNEYAYLQGVSIPVNGTVALNTTLNVLGTSYVSVNVYTEYLNEKQFLPFVYGYATAHAGQDPVLTDYFGMKYDVSTNPFEFNGFAGEPVQVSWDGSSFGLNSVCVSTTLDANGNATISLYAVQQGLIEGSVVTGSPAEPVDDWTANVYLVSNSSFKQFITSIGNASMALSYSPPKAGTYELDITSINSNGQFLYGSVKVWVQTAQIVELGNMTLYSGIHFTGKEGNGAISIPQQAAPGTTITVRATYKNIGSVKLANASLLLEAPAQTSLVPGSIALNFSAFSKAIHVGNYYKVSIGDLLPNSTGVVFYELALSSAFNSTNLNANVFMNYTVQSTKFQELIGTAEALVIPVTINAPPTVATLNIVVSGQAPPESIVTVYDNLTVIGETVAPSGSFWQTNMTLPNEGNASLNILHAQAVTSSGTLNSQTTQVLYNSSLVELVKISMEQPDGRSISFNPSLGVALFPYVIYISEPITFNLYFSDPSKVTNVQVLLEGYGFGNATLGTDGVYQAIFNPPVGGWGASMWDGSINVVYTIVPLPLPSGWNSSLNFTSIFPNATISVGNVTNTSFDYQITDLPNQTIIYGTVSVEANATYAPSQEELQMASLMQMPIYALNMSILANTTSCFAVEESIFIPYAALPKSGGDPPSGTLNKIWGRVIDIKEYLKPYGVTAWKFVAKTFAEVFKGLIWIPQAIHDWSNLIKKIGDVKNNENAWDLSEDTYLVNMLNRIEGESTSYASNMILAAIPTGALIFAIGAVIKSYTGWLPGLLGAGATSLFVGAIFDRYWSVRYLTELDHLDGLLNRIISDAHTSGVNLGKNPVFVDIFNFLHPDTYVEHCRPLWDPSGYAYEGLSSNTIANVVASIFYQDPQTGAWTLWDASAYGQQNNQLTDALGNYGWDVPQGKWMVVYQKPGYRTIQSAVYDVPPPATGVNIDMIPVASPNVTAASAVSSSKSSYVEIEFSQYMKASSLNQNTIYVILNGKNVSGTVTPINPQPDPDGVLLTREALFTPSSPLTSGSVYTVNVYPSVESFANVSMSSSYKAEVTAQPSTRLPPTAVTSSTTNIKRLSLQVTWTPSAATNFARYEIFMSTTNSTLGTSIANITNIAITSLNVTGLSASKTYYFTVRVVSTDGLYADSVQTTATTVVLPTGVTASISGIAENGLTVTWTQTAIPLFVRYEVYESTTQGQLGTLIGTVTNIATTSLSVTGLFPGTTYYFTVRVVAQEGLYADSSQSTATTASIPIWQQTWFIGLVAVVLIAVIAAIVILMRKRSKSSK